MDFFDIIFRLSGVALPISLTFYVYWNPIMIPRPRTKFAAFWIGMILQIPVISSFDFLFESLAMQMLGSIILSVGISFLFACACASHLRRLQI